MLIGHCFPMVIIVQAVHLKLRFTLSCQNIEEIQQIGGVVVDHAAIQKWIFKFTPIIDINFRKHMNRKILQKKIRQ
jgi:putative transposase